MGQPLQTSKKLEKNKTTSITPTIEIQDDAVSASERCMLIETSATDKEKTGKMRETSSHFGVHNVK